MPRARGRCLRGSPRLALDLLPFPRRKKFVLRGAERSGAVRTWAELGEALRHLWGDGAKAGRRGCAALRRGLGSAVSGAARPSCRASPGHGRDSRALLPHPGRLVARAERIPARRRRPCTVVVLVPFRCLS